MTESQLLTIYSSLPDNLKQEAEHYLEFLAQKIGDVDKPKTKRQFGYAKGFFKMAPDFDEPLEDFKEYM